jgi:hypothetical protein
MARHAKVPVVDSFNNSGVPPANRVAAGYTAAATDTRGRYASQIEVVDDRDNITMGNFAHAEVIGDAFSFTPYLLPGGRFGSPVCRYNYLVDFCYPLVRRSF